MLQLYKSCDHSYRDWCHCREHAYTTDRWSYTTAVRKHNLAAAHCLRRRLRRRIDPATWFAPDGIGSRMWMSGSIFIGDGWLGRISQCRHDRNSYRCSYGYKRWNCARFYMFHFLFRMRNSPCRHHGPARCLGDHRCNDLRLNLFDELLRCRDFPRGHLGPPSCFRKRVSITVNRFFF